jgi:WD40 repeat protein
VTGEVGRVYVQRAAAAEGSIVVQVGGDLYVSEEGLSALWTVAETVPGECPYPGLGAFGPSQAKWFFGRERLTGDLLDLLDASLRDRYGGPIVVVGPSGAGKSSLLGAGLVKALRDGRLAVAGSAAWPVITITPGTTPLATLTGTISTCAAALDRSHLPSGPADFRATWESAFAVLRAALHPKGADQVPQHVMVVVDQFEELFTVGCDDAGCQAFLDALTALATPGPDGPAGLVVLGMRADFYGRAAEYPVLRTALQSRQLVLGAMTPTEITQAIIRPARATGLRLESGLTERLMGDLGVGADGITYEAGRLPLLAYALRATWQRRSGNWLTIAGYEATGGIGGAIAKAAEDLYAGLDAGGQRTAQQLFLALVQVGSGEPNSEGIPDTRRRLGRERLCSLTSDPAAARVVLGLFTAARLITSGGQIVEISHDALLLRWPRLRDWIGQDRSGHLIHQSLEEAAEAWDREGRDSAALYGGIRLAAAHQWADNPDEPRNLSSAARDFLTASGRRRRRAIRRRYGIIAILAALSAGLVLLTGYVFNQRAAAVLQRNQTIGNQVVAEAANVGDSNISLAAQLTLAAYRIRPTQDLASRLLATENTPLSFTLFSPSASSGTVQGYQVAFSPSKPILASSDNTNAVRLWDLADPAHPRPLGQSLTDYGAGESLAFSPSGRTLAVGDLGGIVRLWDLTDPAHPRLLGQFGHRGKGINSCTVSCPLAFSSDGHTLAVGGAGGMVRLWDLTDPVRPRPLGQSLTGKPDSGVVSLAFSPDGHTLASSDSLGAIRLWDLIDALHPRLVGLSLTGGHGATSVAFGVGGHILASSGNTNAVRLWDLTDPAHPRPLGQAQTSSGSAVDSVAFSPDGHTLASGSDDGTIRLWDIRDPTSPQPFGQPLTSSGSAVDSVAFSSDGHTLASGSDDGTIRLWSLPKTVLSGGSTVNSVAFSPERNILASSSDDGTIRLWDLADPARPRLLSQSQTGTRIGSVGAVAFSPDGLSMAADESNHAIRLWDITDPAHPRPLAQLGWPQAGTNLTLVNSMAFSPDGHTLASGEEDGTVRLWDITDPVHPRPLGRPMTDSGTWIAFRPIGHMLAVAGLDSTVRLWDLADLVHPKMISKPSLPQAEPASTANPVTFSPDGHTLASGNTDSTIQLWDITDPAHPRPLGQLGQSQIGSNVFVGSVAFSPDGHTLASDNADGVIQLWDVADPAHARLSGQLGQPLAGSSSFDPVAFSRDGHVLADGNADGTIQLWNLNAQYAIQRICVTTGDLTRQQWDQYIPELPYQPLCKH